MSMQRWRKMNRVSKTNTWEGSDGTRYTSAQVDRYVRRACRERMEIQRELFGYNFCMECRINDRNAIIDPSHDVSVDWLKKNGQVEQAWNTVIITPRCRGCHNVRDRLNVQHGKRI